MPANRTDGLSLIRDVYLVKPTIIPISELKNGDSDPHLEKQDSEVKMDNPEQTEPTKLETDPWALPELQADGIPWEDLTPKRKVLQVFINFTKATTLLLLLYLFVCSLNFLSSSFRLVGGRHATNVMTKVEFLMNPVVGLMLGVFATAIVQSSSTSTSIIITMVGSGLLEVRNTIPIIMGANIGTSVTNTFVSLSQAGDRSCFRRAFAAATVHDMFNWLTVIVLLPIEIGTGYLEYVSEYIIGSAKWEQNKSLDKAFLNVITKPFTSMIIQLDKKVLHAIAVGSNDTSYRSLLKQCCDANGTFCETCPYLMSFIGLNDLGTGILLLLISLGMLSGCLYLIVKVLQSVLKGHIAGMIKGLVNAEPRFPLNHLVGYVAIVVGCGITILVQSSSIFTSALTPLAGMGVISIERMYPLTLGSNVGTTTTGILAAFAADPKRLKNTIQIAFCHLLFNVTGILMFYPLPFMRFPVPLAKLLGTITAQYRWFAAIYLISMFILLPMFVLGLSMAGPIVFMSIGIPLFLLFIITIIINILQLKQPGLLPSFLRNWNWLPGWMHSLDPLDRLIVKSCQICTCRCCGERDEKDNAAGRLGVAENQLKVCIIDSRRSSMTEDHELSGFDNTGFAWKGKPECTRM